MLEAKLRLSAAAISVADGFLKGRKFRGSALLVVLKKKKGQCSLASKR